jgi:predicted ATPase
LDRKEANGPKSRTALVTRELKQYHMDIAALSETKFLYIGGLSDVGCGYTILMNFCYQIAKVK